MPTHFVGVHVALVTTPVGEHHDVIGAALGPLMVGALAILTVYVPLLADAVLASKQWVYLYIIYVLAIELVPILVSLLNCAIKPSVGKLASLHIVVTVIHRHLRYGPKAPHPHTYRSSSIHHRSHNRQCRVPCHCVNHR
jgi:hypothetical protein